MESAQDLLSPVPRWPLMVHACAAIFQMFASAYYHLQCCDGEDACIKTRGYDFAGIGIMIAGGGTSAIYYGFMCP